MAVGGSLWVVVMVVVLGSLGWVGGGEAATADGGEAAAVGEVVSLLLWDD